MNWALTQARARYIGLLQCYPAGVDDNSWINFLVKEGRFSEFLLRILIISAEQTYFHPFCCFSGKDTFHANL